MRRICVVAMGTALAGCGVSAQERLVEAREGLAEADYADAIAAAEAGLAAEPGATTSWGLEVVRLEAQARAGRAEAAKEQLRQLAARYPERVPVTQYAATAHQLRSAGQGVAAIEVLDLALKRYPGDAMIERLIGASNAVGVDSAELEMLRSLGYIE